MECFRTFINIISFLLLNYHVNTQSEMDYRLPSLFSPSHYDIELTLTKEVFDGTITTFGGKVYIDFTVLENTKDIKIHGAIAINSLQLSSSDGTILSTNYTYENVTEILLISVNSSLYVGTSYTLSVAYTGNLELVSMHGFYRSEYINGSGVKEYLVTTQFQPTHARKAFPCFDEPRFKSKFSINITYPVGLMALGNTPIEQILTME